MRKKFIAGNWKMYTNAASAKELAAAVVQGLGAEDRVTVAVCPPFPYLAAVASVVKGSKVALGGQNCYFEKEGAFTGEVSPAMLVDVGCKYVILGHSERRHTLGEPSTLISQKVKAALATGLEVILCVGETLKEHDLGQKATVIERQVTQGLAGVAEVELAKIVIAYEPVWAIGTGKNATPDQAQAAHVVIRRKLAELYSEKTAQAVLIQYGGSVKPDNAASLLGQSDVDGALVGGASLKADQFLAIIKAGVR